jgi:hypothetical protein
MSFHRHRHAAASALWLGVVLGVAVAVGAVDQEQKVPSTVARAAAHYRQHRDYVSLSKVARFLRQGMRRDLVKRLVGVASYCHAEEIICYYASDKRDTHGVTIGLVIRYMDKAATVSSPQDSDQVEEARVMSIGE